MRHFNDEAFEEMMIHCNSETEVEVGGLLIGSLLDTKVKVEATLPALEAAAGTANVTFTHEVWDSALNKIETHFPNLQIVGWYHTHPRFGIFMSNYDQFIQQNFFPDQRLIGVVIDPIAGKGGTFQYVSGEVKQTESFETTPIEDIMQTTINAASKKREGRSKWALVLPAIMLISLLLGFLLGGAGSQNNLGTTSTIQDQALVGSSTSCQVRIHVWSGTTYWLLATLLLNDGRRYKELQQQTNNAPLFPGEQLTLRLTTCTVESLNNG